SVVMSLMEFDREKKPKSAEIGTVFGGWWGNALESYNLGSKLWLSLRECITETSLRNACDAVKDALKWMLDDGVAKSVEATAKRVSSDPYLVEFTVTIKKPDGSEEPYQWQVNWRATA
ncbi:MAG: phage GP46 family protein, partial [Treponema sp.]|nr:phage GP46 family protein [Candidatus Treponema caballi]